MSKTVGRLIDILEYISHVPQGASIADISRDLNISKTSVFEIVHAAVEKELLAPGDCRKTVFRIGSKAGEIFGSYISNLGYWPAIHEPLLALGQYVNRSVYFFRCEQRNIILMDVIQSGVSYSPQISLGARLKCSDSRVGHIYLAALGDGELNDILQADRVSGMHQASLRRSLEDIRRQGYMVDNIDVLGIATTCVAVPVFNVESACEGVIAIYDLANRLSPEAIDQSLGQMTDIAMKISKSLGYQGKDLLTVYRRLDVRHPSG